MSRYIDALRRAASGELPVSKQKITPAQFRKDFDLVAKYYGLTDTGEYENAWEAAMDDLEGAITTYAALAKEIAHA